MTEIAIALVDLHLAVTGFTGLLQVGVLVKAGVACFTSYVIEASGQLFSSLEASSCTLDIALNGFEVVLGREATGCISSGHNSGDDGFHLRSLGKGAEKERRRRIQPPIS
jgi:hypothetical protein